MLKLCLVPRPPIHPSGRLWTYESLYRALPTWTPDRDEGPQLEIQNSFGYYAY